MQLKIAINTKKIEGPYGGGNQFVENLERYLTSRGHRVYRSLKDHLDIILIVSSRMNSATTSFKDEQIIRYRKRNPSVRVVHRINTCDEQRAQALGFNRTVLEVNRLADHTVFVSRFMRDLYSAQGFDSNRPHSVLLTGANREVFNPEGRAPWSFGSKIRLVTHHWSKNYLKGFDIYERMDILLGQPSWSEKFLFTYIGNIPPGVNFTNSKVLPVESGQSLADSLKKNHLYLTGARHEPGGNHYIEAMCCGLPVLYLESGSSSEYCSSYGGLAYNLVNFEEKLSEIPRKLEQMRKSVLDFPFNDQKMGDEYESLFFDILGDRDKNRTSRTSILSRLLKRKMT